MEPSKPQSTPVIDMPEVASGIIHTVATRLQLTPALVKQSMMLSAWSTVEELIEREFTGSYRGYYPKCSMNLRAEAVLAEVFDQLAIALDDPRRSLRSGEWTPPGGWTGGAYNG